MWRGGQRLLDNAYGSYVHGPRDEVESAMIEVCRFGVAGDVVKLSSGEAFTISLVTVAGDPWAYVIDLLKRG